eukprot:1134139-Pelagomonas_calceolata.AAC.2
MDASLSSLLYSDNYDHDPSWRCLIEYIDQLLDNRPFATCMPPPQKDHPLKQICGSSNSGICSNAQHVFMQIYFLPNDPFAICVCPGNEDHPPRLIWFNMQNEKLIAELGGKTDNGFGRAGLSGFPGTGSNIPTSEWMDLLPCPRKTAPCIDRSANEAALARAEAFSVPQQPCVVSNSSIALPLPAKLPLVRLQQHLTFSGAFFTYVDATLVKQLFKLKVACASKMESLTSSRAGAAAKVKCNAWIKTAWTVQLGQQQPSSVCPRYFSVWGMMPASCSSQATCARPANVSMSVHGTQMLASALLGQQSPGTITFS